MLMSKKGFTLIELMVVISIIAILSLIGVTTYSGVLNKARNAKITSDFDAIYKNIEIARQSQRKTLGQITGNWCSDCGGCRTGDLSTDTTLTCLNTMTASYLTVTAAPLPLDPWGIPYVWDENEGEGGSSCSPDYLRTVGPDHTWGTSDDQGFYVPLSGFTGC